VLVHARALLTSTLEGVTGSLAADARDTPAMRGGIGRKR
jgi:hypothetical protein